MSILKLSFVYSFVLFTSPVFAKQVALTIDDAPSKDEGIYSGLSRTMHFIEILRQEKIKAVFFCNSIHLNEANGRKRLNAYAESGHLIGNHTHSHSNLHNISATQFIADVDEADKQLSQFPNFRKWFRFPFLKEGRTLAIRDEIRRHLKSKGYRNAYVTVDNYDYVINDRVQKGLSNNLKVDLPTACKTIGDITLDGLEEQEKAASKYIKQNVVQVLLMHENDVEAYCLEKTLKKLKENGWKIVTPAVAFTQNALSREPNTLWLDQGRINAYIAEQTGHKFKLKWDSTSALNSEMNRRKLVLGD